jgi:beta-lactamase superfamily II metal-dependent hydrolase
MGIRFEFFEAGCGDSILVSTDEGTNILIDGGVKDTYFDSLEEKYEEFKNEGKKLDLVILSHYDDDHIAGLVELLDAEKREIFDDENYDPVIKEVWSNSFEGSEWFDKVSKNDNTSASQNDTFTQFMQEIKHKVDYKDYLSIDYERVLKKNDIQFILLSPDNTKVKNLYKQENDNTSGEITTQTYSKDSDKSMVYLAKKSLKKNGDFKKESGETRKENGASIAFILIYQNKKYLFLADARIPLIVEELSKLTKHFNSRGKIEFEFIKLSHHGSKQNLNQAFLNLIECENFIILTNGSTHKHPDKETLSKIILNMSRKDDETKINFIFNYPHMTKHNKFTSKECQDYKFDLMYSKYFPVKGR